MHYKRRRCLKFYAKFCSTLPECFKKTVRSSTKAQSNSSEKVFFFFLSLFPCLSDHTCSCWGEEPCFCESLRGCRSFVLCPRDVSCPSSPLCLQLCPQASLTEDDLCRRCQTFGKHYVFFCKGDLAWFLASDWLGENRGVVARLFYDWCLK